MAQKVTQNQSEISVLEKEDVTLNCAYEVITYSGTSNHQAGKLFSLFIRTLTMS